MLENEAEKMDDAQHRAADCAAEEERSRRVARVIESVRSGTYQVRSDVAANRLIDAMIRRPRKGR